MKAFKWMLAGALGILLISGSPALAQGNSQGHGHGKGHDKHHDDDDRDDRNAYRYDYHEQAIRGWYSASETSSSRPRQERSPASRPRKAISPQWNPSPRSAKAFVSCPRRVGALFAPASAGLRARLSQRPHRSAEPQNESDR